MLRRDSLDDLFGRLLSEGRRIVAPVRNSGRVVFAEVADAQSVAFDYVQTAISAKEELFPRYESLLSYRQAGKDFEVDASIPPARPTVLFGVHPCDAASLATLSAVFTWGSPDGHFESKLAATTVIGLSCTRADAYCFCTSVGGGPGATRGSDMLLTPLDAETFLVEVLSEKGDSIVALAPQLFVSADGRVKESVLADVPARFTPDGLADRLAKLFACDDAWVDQSLRCVGCGACAFVCPTCSCFDIQDERDRRGGFRLRIWDSCGLAQFTLHASGHNPRSRQAERWRQRVMHKFSYQPQRLGVTGCVGCGRCSRACPVDMNLAEHVGALAEMGG